ncbi:hypothetical protein FRUB_08600 [Fimbriiglobus ruber]|uniref:Uncharacterized protein n=1 Tax=Fimbriiglobus ruber TaxID=1908690 RepID=A0A225DIU5_9BACT|nr:hypothetical protein FRUB_08600 [Fimbriiglobus ruber]
MMLLAVRLLNVGFFALVLKQTSVHTPECLRTVLVSVLVALSALVIWSRFNLVFKLFSVS